MYDRWSAAIVRQSLQKVPGLKKIVDAVRDR